MNPIDAITRLVELGVKQSTLEQYLGLRSGRISELIKGRSYIKTKEQELIVVGLQAFKTEFDKIEIDTTVNENNYSVYAHYFPDEKRYYGISQSPETRWGENGEGYKNQKRIWTAIQKFGWENVKHEIIMSNLNKQSALMIEEALINQYKTNIPACGYNEYV